MRIDYERSGGFAGMRITTTVDTQSLPADQGKEMAQLVASSGFFNIPSTPPPAGGADMYTYKVTVTDGGQTHTVTVKDGSIPPALQPLLQRLTAMARR